VKDDVTDLEEVCVLALDDVLKSKDMTVSTTEYIDERLVIILSKKDSTHALTVHGTGCKDIDGNPVLEGDILVPVYGGKQMKVIWHPEYCRYALMGGRDYFTRLTPLVSEKHRIKKSEAP
jgi:hypothetical protein